MNHKLLSKLILFSFLMIFLKYDAAALAGWSSMDTEVTNVLYDVWGSSATDVFAVGTLGFVLHYDGNSEGTWSDMDHRGH